MATKRMTRSEPHKRTEVPSVVTLFCSYIKEVFGGAKKSKRKPTMHSRSFTPSSIYAYEAQIAKLGWSHEQLVEDEEFFDEPIPTSPLVRPTLLPKAAVSTKEIAKTKAERDSESKWTVAGRRRRRKEAKRQGVVKRAEANQLESRPEAARATAADDDDDDDDDDGPWDEIVEFFDNSDRDQHGLGLVRKVFGGNPPNKDWKPRRPYFTWWMTIVQLIIFIVSCAVYGIAPVGMGKTEITGEVPMTSLVVEKVSYKEQSNLWIGPRENDLIHLGARFSPCMRKDKNLQKVFDCDKNLERETACCVRNDGSGCVQSQQADCPVTLATWFNWTESQMGYQDRLSGSVCGQDPKYCNQPASSGAFKWPDDITQWPLCEEPSNVTTRYADNIHMTCEVIGRPCCVGIQGECVIATREYCDFRRGYFHENASLCSQVQCFEQVCGMFPFGDPEIPDQFYRLFSVLFLHAGIVSIVITVVFQFLIMRDLERICGWWRMTITYIGGGVAGSLASATFLPYHVEAGPSGSQFAVLAALIVEIFRWNKDERPFRTVGWIILMLIILFVVGLLPGIDNYAHLFGFFYGLFLSICFRPYKSLCNREFNFITRLVCALVAGALAVVVFVILVIFFYVSPIYECEACSYFNCIPFTADFCDSMHVTIQRTESECLI